MSAREKIVAALRPLVGLPLWEARFAASMLNLQFGTRNHSSTRHCELVEVGDYALHVLCDWRFTLSDEIVVGAYDHYSDPDSGNSEEILQRINQLLSSNPTVLEITFASASAFGLLLDGGCIFELFPSRGSGTNHEFWRLFSPLSEANHFVVGSRGIHVQ